MSASLPLYRRVLGQAFDDLPPEIRAMHMVTDRQEAHGRCRVDRGCHPLARLIAWLFRLPAAGSELPVTVRFAVENGREVWRRDFDGSVMVSVQEITDGTAPGALIERFGPFAFELAVPAGHDGLALEPRRMWFLGMPLPSVLMPRVDAGESVEDGRFRFDVRIALPWVGALIHYRGHLTPAVTDEAERKSS